MSTLGPYSFRVTTSGAIQYGVPTIVVRFACAGSEIWAQNPKSAKSVAMSVSCSHLIPQGKVYSLSLMSPVMLRRILSLLISR